MARIEHRQEGAQALRSRRWIGWTFGWPWTSRRMWRRGILAICALLVAVAPWAWQALGMAIPSAASVMAPREWPEEVRRALYGKVIVIDPGHGGADPGAVGAAGVQEKEINLAVATRLYRLLYELKAAPLLTRVEDASPAQSGDDRRAGLLRRVEVLQGRKVAVFVSVHANKFGRQTPWQGAQTFYEPQGHPQGQALAQSLQRALGEVTGTTRVVRPVDQLVLREAGKAGIPAATVEVGFLSNVQEEARLKDPGYQQQLAEAIALGLGRFLAQSAP